MKYLLSLVSLAALSTSVPQLKFSSDEPNPRLGLLASNLGLSPTAESNPRTGSLTEAEVLSGRVPGAPTVGAEAVPAVQTTVQDQCCCIPADQDCFDLYAVDDLVGQGLIDPRKGSELATRIVNRPPAQPSDLNVLNTCPVGYKTCCYAPDLDLSVFQRNAQCLTPYAAAAASQQLNTQQHTYWTQGCQEAPVYGSKQCGTRNYPGPVSGLTHGQSSPGEFPWTCILLNQNNDFVGTCAIITDDSTNNNNQPTRKVLTAAHKLKNIATNE